MIRINLLSARSQRRRKKAKRQLIFTCLSFFVLFSFFGAVFIVLSLKASYMRADIEQKRVEYVAIKKKIGELARLRIRKKKVKEKLDAVSMLERKRRGPVKLLHTVSRAIPRRAWLDSLDEDEDSGSVYVRGAASSERVVAALMRRLVGDDETKDVKLEVMKKVEDSRGAFVSFTLNLSRIEKVPE